MEFLKRKNVFITSLILVALFVLLGLIMRSSQCKLDSVCSSLYWSEFWSEKLPTILFVLIISIFPFSTLTLFAPNNAFDRWKRFAVWAVPILALLTLPIIKALSGDWLDVATPTLVFLYGIYFIISLAIIIRAWRKERKLKNNP